MGGSVSSGTQTSGPSNPAVNDLVTKLSKGLAGEYTPGKSLYVPPGANTTAGQAASLNAASNPNYAAGIGGAINDFADVAAGNRFGTNDPGYATLRNKVLDDTKTNIYSDFNNSGLFGSDSNMKAAGEGIGNALANLDYGNYQQDIQRQQAAVPTLMQLFQGQQLPGSIQQSVGASQDAAANAASAGPTDYLAKLIGAAGGAAGASPQTAQKDVPLWQLLLGGAASLA